MAEGIRSTGALNNLLVCGLPAIGSFYDVVLDSDAIRRFSEWLRADPARRAAFEVLHGDDEEAVASGFHNVQNDGVNQKFRGLHLGDTVLEVLTTLGLRSLPITNS